MGLNKKSMNYVLFFELGRFFLYYDIVNRLLKYCYRLENLIIEFFLLKDVFLCSKEFYFV